MESKRTVCHFNQLTDLVLLKMSMRHLLKELQEQKHKYINLHAAVYTGIPLVCWGLVQCIYTVPALWARPSLLS